jgi:hypothetical protein
MVTEGCSNLVTPVKCDLCAPEKLCDIYTLILGECRLLCDIYTQIFGECRLLSGIGREVLKM